MIIKTRKYGRKKHRINTGEQGDEPSEEEERAIVQGDKVILGLFSSFDNLKLERLVGTDKHKQIISNKTKDTFQFMQ